MRLLAIVRINRWVSSLCGILLGLGLCIPPFFLLVLMYGLCLTDPSRPDYYTAKLWMMFWNTDLVLFTWPSVGMLLFGLSVAVIRGLRPFLNVPPAAAR